MGKRVRITNGSLNSYGCRILTEGMDISQYERNPVMLYMHERGRVIGYMKDLKKEGDEVTGEPVFDCASELSTQCKKQWEFGSLKMVSVGIDILETSDDKAVVVEGQTFATITRSRLFEVSVVDIGANDDAIRLRRDGKMITLGDGGENPLPLITNNKKQNTKEMELKVIALQLGLPETADEAAVNARIAELKTAELEKIELAKQAEELTTARIETSVDKAISEKKIGQEKRDQFIQLGKKVGAKELDEVLGAMAPQVKLSNVVGQGSGAQVHVQTLTTYTKLSEVPADELLKMRQEDKETYRRLYKAEYGMECKI